jgi:hypothetical protein
LTIGIKKVEIESSNLSWPTSDFMKTWKIIVAGIVFAIIAEVINTLVAFATMNFYTDPTYFEVWSKIMMPTAGPPTAEFYYYSIAFSIITGIIYAIVYEIIKKSMLGNTVIKRGLYFGFLLFLIGAPGFLTMYLLINLPALLVVYWTISSLIVDLIFGTVVAKLSK